MVWGKTQMRRIENVTSRQVTFSKRQNGLQKKAFELSRCFVMLSQIRSFQRSVKDRSIVDFFDQLPDEILFSNFKILQKGKSLCISMTTCKCFCSIAPLVDEVSLPIPKKRTKDYNSIKNLMVRVLMKSFNFISQMMKFRSKVDKNDLNFYSGYLQK